MKTLRRAYESGWLLVAILGFVAVEATALLAMVALGVRP